MEIKKEFGKVGVFQLGLRCWGRISVGEEGTEGHSGSGDL